MTFSALLAQRVDAARRSPGFANYSRVREHVLRMKDQAPASQAADPSVYWQEELANFDYMLDAHPLVVDRLRHHTYHITGLRLYDYRSRKDQAQAAFEDKLEAL